MNSEIKSNQDEDFKWFRENYKWLYEKYGECWVVIVNKTIMFSAMSHASGVHRALDYFEPGTFIVQKLGPTEDCFTAYVNEESK